MTLLFFRIACFSLLADDMADAAATEGVGSGGEMEAAAGEEDGLYGASKGGPGEIEAGGGEGSGCGRDESGRAAAALEDDESGRAAGAMDGDRGRPRMSSISAVFRSMES